MYMVRTTDLPGIGKRISFKTAADQLLVIIIHHTGKKELHFFDDPDADQATCSLTLTAEEGRELAAQLLGISYQPAALDKMKAFRKEIVIEWLELKAESPLVNKSIKESRIRTLTGASVIGIIRDDNFIASPGIDEVILKGDTLVSVGKAEQIKELEKLCQGAAEV